MDYQVYNNLKHAGAALVRWCPEWGLFWMPHCYGIAVHYLSHRTFTQSSQGFDWNGSGSFQVTPHCMTLYVIIK